MAKKGERKQFCKRGHEIAKVGRDKWGSCNGCVKPVALGICVPKIRNKKQFCKRGHDTFQCGRVSNGTCRICVNLRNKRMKEENPDYWIEYQNIHKEEICEKVRKYRKEHIEQITIKNQKWWHDHPDYLKQWLEENKEIVAERRKQYYEDNKNEILLANKKYAKEHPEAIKMYKLKCSTNRALRIPEWADWENIIEFERRKPKNKVVDHYIPMQGKLVSGLHVSRNLQYLTPLENSKKNNKANLKEISEWYGKILEEAGLKY